MIRMLGVAGLLSCGLWSWFGSVAPASVADGDCLEPRLRIADWQEVLGNGDRSIDPGEVWDLWPELLFDEACDPGEVLGSMGTSRVGSMVAGGVHFVESVDSRTRRSDSAVRVAVDPRSVCGDTLGLFLESALGLDPDRVAEVEMALGRVDPVALAAVDFTGGMQGWTLLSEGKEVGAAGWSRAVVPAGERAGEPILVVEGRELHALDESVLGPVVSANGMHRVTLRLLHALRLGTTGEAVLQVRSAVTSGAWVVARKFVHDSVGELDIDLTDFAAEGLQVRLRFRDEGGTGSWTLREVQLDGLLRQCIRRGELTVLMNGSTCPGVGDFSVIGARPGEAVSLLLERDSVEGNPCHIPYDLRRRGLDVLGEEVADQQGVARIRGELSQAFCDGGARAFIANRCEVSRYVTLGGLPALAPTIPVKVEPEGRYVREVFQSVKQSRRKVYGMAVPSSGKLKRLGYHLFQPVGDLETRRPLIITMNGGHLVNNRGDDDGMYEFARRMVRMGYVVADISTRRARSIGELRSEPTLTKLRADQDVRAAVRYFRKDALGPNNNRIDPERIMLAGNSGGGLLAIRAGFVREFDDDGAYDAERSLVEQNGGFEGDSGTPGASSYVFAVLSFSGGGARSMVDRGDPALGSAHFIGDPAVSYERTWRMHQRMHVLGMPHQLLSLEGEIHGAIRLEDNLAWMGRFAAAIMFDAPLPVP